MWSSLKRWRPWQRLQPDEAASVWRGLRAGQGGVETVLGLPHALAAPLLERHFKGKAVPSSAGFARHGRDGYWTLPPPHPFVQVRLIGDDHGRLAEGEVRSAKLWAGVCLYTLWAPENERVVWQILASRDAPHSLLALIKAQGVEFTQVDSLDERSSGTWR